MRNDAYKEEYTNAVESDEGLQWINETDRGCDVLEESASRESFQRAILRHEQAACALWVKAVLSQDMYESGQPVQVLLSMCT